MLRRWLSPRAHAERRLTQELEFHLQERAAELEAEGLSAADAVSRARQELGAMDPILEGCRDQRWWRGLDDLARDARYALRSLSHARVFSIVALLTLTLGIGANAALFQVYEALVLRAVPVPDPEALHVIRIRPGTPRSGNFTGNTPLLTSAQVEELRRTDVARDGFAVWSNFRFNLNDSGEARFAETLMVSGDYFRVLGLQAQRGRLLSTDDDQPGCGAGAAVLSHTFWRTTYGGADVIGQSLRLGGHVFQIAGVAPAGFSGLDIGRDFDVAVPLCAEQVLRGDRTMSIERHNWWLALAARLAPGESLEARTAKLEALSPALFQATLPPMYRPELARPFLEFKLAAIDARRGVSGLRQQFTSPLHLLMGVTVLVLVIACVNLANLLLARMSHRQRELAVRLAVGASRARLARVVAVEAGLLAAMGTLAGVALSTPLSRWLVTALISPGESVHLDVQVNWTLLAAAGGIGLFVSLLCALAPTLRAAATPPGQALRDGLRTTSSTTTLWWRRALIVTEVALTFVLVVGAVLMARTLQQLQAVDLGFDARGLVTTELAIEHVPDWQGRRLAILDALQERLGGLSFVRGVSTLDYVPIGGSTWNDTVRVDGGGAVDIDTQLNRVGETFFDVMDTPVREGRVFTTGDRAEGTALAVVNQAYQEQAFKGASAIGRRVRFLSEPTQAYEIIGVVSDTKYGSLREARQPVIFVSTRQQLAPGPFISLVVRTNLPAAAAIPLIRSAVLDVEPTVTLETRALQDTIDSSLRIERLLTRLSLFFGGLALLLAGVGLYGVIAYTAAQRRRDIGIRLALGAPRRGVVLQVVGHTGWLIAAGLLTGAAACVPLSRWVEGLVFGVTTRDLAIYGVAGGVLAVVGVLAAWLPAWRAARMNPTAALRVS
ncbi:MAG TPA: ADOP family duplicated permease [Luteitalea sp.]|nr:ADOP family duplicated permease [Luteitalea sp.]